MLKIDLECEFLENCIFKNTLKIATNLKNNPNLSYKYILQDPVLQLSNQSKAKEAMLRRTSLLK